MNLYIVHFFGYVSVKKEKEIKSFIDESDDFVEFSKSYFLIKTEKTRQEVFQEMYFIAEDEFSKDVIHFMLISAEDPGSSLFFSKNSDKCAKFDEFVNEYRELKKINNNNSEDIFI